MNSDIYDLLLTLSSFVSFIVVVFFLTKLGNQSNINNKFRMPIALASVLILVSIIIFQIEIIGVIVGGGAAAGYIMILTLFVEVALGLALLIRAARFSNLKYNSIKKGKNTPFSKYSYTPKWVSFIFIAIGFCFIILIALLHLFKMR